MTAAIQIDGGAALTLAWVRTALLTMAEDIVGPKETRRVARADEAMLADVKAAAGGDGEAYRRIIDRYQDTIARRMVRFTRDPRMIEELVHDVFVEAYFGLGGYRGRRAVRTLAAAHRHAGRLPILDAPFSGSGDDRRRSSLRSAGRI